MASLWASLREALRGGHEDFTTGPLRRAVFLLAVPMVLEMVLESLFAVTDIFFVAKLGADAVATVGLTEGFLTLVYGVSLGLGIGATALVARRIGEKDALGAAAAAAQALWLSVGFGLAGGLLGLLFAPTLLTLLGASPAVVATGTGYARVMFGGQLVIYLLFVANSILRSAGDAATAMRVLWLASALNIVLGPCLIFGVGPLPRLGLEGAAVATTFGRAVGAAYALTLLVRGGGKVALRRFGLDLPVLRQLVAVAAPASLQLLISMTSFMALVRIVSLSGSVAVAGYTIGIRIVIFIFLPVTGISNACATLVGQALGANDAARAEAAVWLSGRYAALFLGGASLLLALFAPPFVALFSDDADIARDAIACLRILSAGAVFWAYGLVFESAFNGAGDTRTPTLLNLVVFWLVQAPLAWLLARDLGWGSRGVYVAVFGQNVLLYFLSWRLFRRGRWRMVRL